MTASVSPEVIERWRADFKLAYKVPEHLVMKRGKWFHKQDKWAAVAIELNKLFDVWCNARQSAVIDLPDPIEFDSGHDEPSFHYWPSQIKSALRKQGYQVNFNHPTHG